MANMYITIENGYDRPIMKPKGKLMINGLNCTLISHIFFMILSVQVS